MPDDDIGALRSRVDGLTQDLARASATLGVIKWLGGVVGAALIGGVIVGQIRISDVTGVAGVADDLARSASEAAVAATDQLNGIETRVSGLAGEAVAAAIGGLDGMVAVFGEDGCPSGWQDFEDGAGRFILGVGQGVDENGDPLTNREFGESLGKESVQLTVDTMPTHNHNFLGDEHIPEHTQAFIMEFDEEQGSFGLVPDAADRLTVDQSPSAPGQGNNQPHNNMPPYIALHFCEYVGVGAASGG